MATEALAAERTEDGRPFIPDADLERLIAEMLGHGRQGSAPPRAAARPAPVEAPRQTQQAAEAAAIEALERALAAPPAVSEAPPVRAERHGDPQLDPQPLAIGAAAGEAELLSEPIEPLAIARPRKRRRKGAFLLLLAAVLVGGGGWLALNGLPPRLQDSLRDLAFFTQGGRQPPVIAAPSGAARTQDVAPAQPTRIVAAPPPAAPAPSAPPQAASPAPPPPAATTLPDASAVAPAASQPAAPSAPPRALAPPPDSAGVLGNPEIGPFDQAAEPRPVRTTLVTPPRPGEIADSAPPRPLDFDDPSTWPPGAVPADSHPLPPRRAR